MRLSDERPLSGVPRTGYSIGEGGRRLARIRPWSSPRRRRVLVRHHPGGRSERCLPIRMEGLPSTSTRPILAAMRGPRGLIDRRSGPMWMGVARADTRVRYRRAVRCAESRALSSSPARLIRFVGRRQFAATRLGSKQEVVARRSAEVEGRHHPRFEPAIARWGIGLLRPRVAVLGVGGVGGYFGGRLAQNQEADVVFLARGPHLDVLRSRGLQVKSLLGDFHVDVDATDDTALVGPVDFVLLSVKTYDNEAAIASIHPLVGSDTAVVSLQNGVDNEGLIADAIGAEHVLGGAVFIFSRVTEPGVVAHTGGPARIAFGELDGRSSTRAERLLTLFEAAGVDTVLSDDIRRLVWDKFVFICAQAGMTATSRLPIGDIRSVPETWEAFLAILDEVAEVAAAEGVALEGVRDRHGAFAQGLEGGSYSSLYDDMVNGRPMEVEALHGALVRLADRHDIAVPVSRTVYAILKPWSLKNLRDTD